MNRFILCGFLRLFAHLHPEIFTLHVERIVAALHQLFAINHLVVADSYSALITTCKAHYSNYGHASLLSECRTSSSLSSTSTPSSASKPIMKSEAVDETIISLLAVCQRCAPLKLPPFLVSHASLLLPLTVAPSSVSSSIPFSVMRVLFVCPLCKCLYIRGHVPSCLSCSRSVRR